MNLSVFAISIALFSISSYVSTQNVTYVDIHDHSDNDTSDYEHEHIIITTPRTTTALPDPVDIKYQSVHVTYGNVSNQEKYYPLDVDDLKASHFVARYLEAAIESENGTYFIDDIGPLENGTFEYDIHPVFIEYLRFLNTTIDIQYLKIDELAIRFHGTHSMNYMTEPTPFLLNVEMSAPLMEVETTYQVQGESVYTIVPLHEALLRFLMSEVKIHLEVAFVTQRDQIYHIDGVDFSMSAGNFQILEADFADDEPMTHKMFRVTSASEHLKNTVFTLIIKYFADKHNDNLPPLTEHILSLLNGNEDHVAEFVSKLYIG